MHCSCADICTATCATRLQQPSACTLGALHRLMSLFHDVDAVCVMQVHCRPRHLARLASPLCCPHCRCALHRALSPSRQARLTAARQLQVAPHAQNMRCCWKGMRQR